MNVLISLDSFKGSLDARTACESVAAGLREVRRDLKVVIKPLADGGEGTADILMLACDGEWRHENVMGPLPHMAVDAGYTVLKKPDVTVVEMAAASGLTLLDARHRQPLKTTTYGTGQLLKAAFEIGKPVWLAIGGSATVDGGIGAAMALGWQFLDKRGESVLYGGGELERIAEIVPPFERKWPRVEVLCDVRNPLCGRMGAARVFGPQKGATPQVVAKLELGLRHLAQVIRRDVGVDVLTIRGGGAAGGLGAGAVAFLGAKIRSGIETIVEAISLRPAIAHADWVITGEGSFDAQSLQGKVVSGVITEAKKVRTKICVIAGRVGLDEKAWRKAGIASAHSLVTNGVTEKTAMTRVRELLQARAREFAAAHLAAKG